MRPTDRPHLSEIPIVEAEDSPLITQRKLPYGRFCLDAALIFAMGIGLEIFCRIYGTAQAGILLRRRGNSSYPYLPQSVSLFALLNYCFLTNCVLILFVEFHRLHKNETEDEFYSQLEHGRTLAGRLLVRFAIFFGYEVMCLLVVLTLTTATKYPTGRLRPHFMDVCRPNIGYEKCNTTTYIPANEYNCTGPFAAAILEARLSFFSGHSSLSASAATFSVFYLQDRLAGQLKSRVIVPCIQTIVYIIALWIAYTRIFDNWHHWSDVLAGVLVGTIVTAALCKFVVGLNPRVQTTRDAEKEHLMADGRRAEGGRDFLCAFCGNRAAGGGIPHDSLA
ncbi:AcidPPc domain-containing protein [Aphelenchoides fujianensis]|nr:AcidPPc domain-containing protein [Aphelenchoides fujianensis]